MQCRMEEAGRTSFTIYKSRRNWIQQNSKYLIAGIMVVLLSCLGIAKNKTGFHKPGSTQQKGESLNLVDDTDGHKKNDTKEKINLFLHCLNFGKILSKFVERDENSDFYSHLNKQWNLRIAKVYPIGYFLPTTTHDVANFVKCAVRNSIRVVPNSGGHSYEAISWGTNETVVVDFRNMKRMRVEGSGENATGILEPGANVGLITAYLWEHGGYGTPMGNGLTVGIGGHAIGGGSGLYSSLYGLAVDNIVQVELVDARGNVVVANKGLNADLFWAMRGSGPGYIGIVTQLTMKLFQASKIKATFVKINYPVKSFPEGFMKFQTFQAWLAEDAPNAYASFTHRRSSGMVITCVHIQDPTVQPEDSVSFLEAINMIFKYPGVTQVEFPSYIQIVGMAGSADVDLRSPFTGKIVPVKNLHSYYGTPRSAVPDEGTVLEFLRMLRKDDVTLRYFKAKSFFTKRTLKLEEVLELQEITNRIPENVSILCSREQGVIQRLARNATAYVHRDSLFDILIQYEGSVEPAEVEEGMKFVYHLWDAMQFMNDGESYQNNPDLDIKDHLNRYYKENLPRLLLEKRKWDPKDYFKTPLSIPVKVDI